MACFHMIKCERVKNRKSISNCQKIISQLISEKSMKSIRSAATL
uniref:Uncharacterized protein n=1 Tax=Rhizophora mucronata TaxID=61149 RepID=A0A2P2PVM8_RHIMU